MQWAPDISYIGGVRAGGIPWSVAVVSLGIHGTKRVVSTTEHWRSHRPHTGGHTDHTPHHTTPTGGKGRLDVEGVPHKAMTPVGHCECSVWHCQCSAHRLPVQVEIASAVLVGLVLGRTALRDCVVVVVSPGIHR